MISIRMIKWVAFLPLLTFMTTAAQPEAVDSTQKAGEVKMKMTSPAFKDGEMIPIKYTCDGADISPALEFIDVPAVAKSLALLCDDPDAPSGDWVHWVLFDIPPQVKGLPEKIMTAVAPMIKIEAKVVPMLHGENDFGNFGYGGPCPPRGNPHRYYFKLFALDKELKPDKETTARVITKKKLLDMMKGHIVAEASLMGKYQRK